MNVVKRSLVEKIRDRIEASKKVRASSILVSDLLAGLWGLASSFCSPMKSVGGLLQARVKYKILKLLQ